MTVQITDGKIMLEGRCAASASLFEVDPKNLGGGLVLFLYIDFAVRSRDIRGYIAMIMDIPSLETLKELLGEFIERVVGDDV
jgi:chemotaxis protein CheC